MFWMGLLTGAALGFALGVLFIAMFVANSDDTYDNHKDFVVEKIEEVWIDNGKVVE